MKTVFTLAALGALATAAPASAGYVTVDLSPYVNGNWASQGFGDVPQGNQTLGGTPFAIASNNGSAGYRVFAGVGPQSLTILTNIFGVTNAYSLLNTFWGTSAPAHSVTFAATGGLSQTFTLSGNTDLRDYLQSGYTNTINGTTTVNVFNSGQRRLDMQIYDLAAAFDNQTLTSITFNDIGADGVGRMVLTGLTLQTADVGGAVPEPATWAMMVAGFGAVGAALRRRKAAPRVSFAA